jgi:hypothetical protein
MCMGKNSAEKTTSECRGKCSGSGQAKLSDSELQKQQQECHGSSEISLDNTVVKGPQK